MQLPSCSEFASGAALEASALEIVGDKEDLVSLESTPKAKAIRRLAVVDAQLESLLESKNKLLKLCSGVTAMDDASCESQICYRETRYYKQAAESALVRCDWEQLVDLSQSCCELAVKILVPVAKVAIATMQERDAADEADKLEHLLVKVLRPFTDILGAEKTKLS